MLSAISFSGRAFALLAALAVSFGSTAARAEEATRGDTAPVETASRFSNLKPNFRPDIHSVQDLLDKSWLDVNGLSYHFDRRNPHNERNWGLGLEIPTSDRSMWMVGTYKNSQWHQTNYAWFVDEPWHVGRVQLGWMAGLATGYRDDPWTPMFVGGLAATIRGERWGAHLICLPPALCAANLTFKLR